MTTFLTLDEWGGTANGWGQMALPVSELWVHHSVTDEDIGVNPTDDAIADFRDLDRIGLSRGHGGISYSYAIHPEGVVGEGQGTRIGAHTAVPGHDRNPWSFGVVFVGNFDPRTGNDAPTPAAVDSFHWLRDRLIASGVLMPGVYPTGGHRDAPGQSTACPGDNIEAILDLLRAPRASTPTPEVYYDMPTLLRVPGGGGHYFDGPVRAYFGEDQALADLIADPRVIVIDTSTVHPGSGDVVAAAIERQDAALSPRPLVLSGKTGRATDLTGQVG